ncbi:MAG: hypothetical protein CME04_20435 [Gemmatimonadaceae bacterium]|nr:hypothetical protein [Gemmatimonadaceae bacterium]
MREYGLDPAELIGTSLFDLIHPEDRERARHRVDDRRTGERSTRSFELRLVFADNKSMPFEWNESDTTRPLVQIDAEGVYSSDRPSSADFLYTQGVARNISARQAEESSLEDMRREMTRRMGAHAMQIRAAYRQLQVQLEERERHEAETETIQRIRDEIWRMVEPEQVDEVLRAIGGSLRDLGVNFHGISINHVDESTGQVGFYSFEDDRGGWSVSEDAGENLRVMEFMKAGVPAYRPDLHIDDPWGELELIEAGWGPPIRSVIDVPFESGTFAINSREADAFPEREQALLSRMTGLLQEGFHRVRDLQALRERSREAERLAAERQDALRKEVVLSRARDQILSMHSLRDGPQHRDMMAALRDLGVPVDGLSVQFPASTPGHYDTYYTSDFPVPAESLPLDDYPWVRQVWETGRSVVVGPEQLRDSAFEDWETYCLVEAPLPGGGSLGVSRQDGGTFTDDMIQTVESFAGVVAAGFQRLRDFGRLEESEERYRHMLENLPLAVVYSLLDGTILYSNPMARTMYGYTEEEWKGVTGEQLYVNPQDRAELMRTVQGQQHTEFGYAMRHKSGREIWVRGLLTLVANPATGRQEIHGFTEDVTERKEMEAQNALLEEQLRQSQKMEAVGQLTAGIAHNFNNMLQGISGNLQLAILDAEGEMGHRLADADRVTHRAADMIRQLMVFARQGIKPAIRSVQLRPIVQNTIEICRRTFDRKIAIETDLEEEIHVVGDPGLLQQVLLNILINSRDAVYDGGTESPLIRLRAEIVHVSGEEASDHLDATEGPHVEVQIRDNGIGMDSETQRHIFEPFFTTKPVDRGTGLGLATV